MGESFDGCVGEEFFILAGFGGWVVKGQVVVVAGDDLVEKAGHF